MEIMTVATYVLITATTLFLFTVLFAPRTIKLRIQKYFLRNNFPASKALHPSAPLSPVQSPCTLQWGEIHFCDKEYGFPVMQVKIYNAGNEISMVERIKFTIDVAGRLRNRVEGHCSLFIAPWSYTVQFDPLFEGNSIVVDLSTVVQPHTSIQLLFTIGQETSDVETPTLYRFHLQIEDSHNRRIISKPLTIAIPSPVRAKSYSMLEERANVIAQNAAIVNAFSSSMGYCNPLARRILGHQSVWLQASDHYLGL